VIRGVYRHTELAQRVWQCVNLTKAAILQFAQSAFEHAQGGRFAGEFGHRAFEQFIDARRRNGRARAHREVEIRRRAEAVTRAIQIEFQQRGAGIRKQALCRASQSA